MLLSWLKSRVFALDLLKVFYEYFIKYPNIKNEIEESKKKDTIPIALGIFVMQQGKIRYPYGIKIYKEEEKKKCSIRQMIQKKFGWN